MAAREPTTWPRVSVVIAARDEAQHLEHAASSLLAADYPDLEVVIVDDRSSDGTAEVASALAEKDPRLRLVRLTTLPDGWLGKVHALQAGTQAASGSWILYTDADVEFGRESLRRAIAFALERDLDHLAVAPDVVSPGFWLETTTNAFAAAFLLGTRAVDAERPGSRAVVGIGAFNLVRRAALDRTPGFEWLRLEVLDDVALGLMIREAGGRQAFALGLGEVRLTWYRSLPDMARGLEKNMFGAISRYSYGRAAAQLVALAALLAGPVVALVQPDSIPVRATAAVAMMAWIAGAVVVRRRIGRRFSTALMAPLGFVVLGTILARSALACLRRGGVTWRGTTYPLAQLRSGMRVRI